MTKRKKISKKVRFEIFKRDSFCCQYCGGTPPSAVLELDHVKPVSAGGSDEKDNLVTACMDCNRGKGATELSSIPDTLERRAEIAKEKEEQRKAYEQVLRARARRISRSVKKVEAAFQEYFPDQCFKQRFKASVQRFLEEMTEPELVEVMDYACSRIGHHGAERSLKYFCGVCWKKIREAA